MMDKLQEVCKQHKGGTELLAKFYLELLPAIKSERAGEVSRYCIDMYQQAKTLQPSWKRGWRRSSADHRTYRPRETYRS
jgi:hypothetical protein